MMGRLAIVEEDDVSSESSTVLPPTKKYRSNDNCYTGLKCNQKSRQYIQEAQGKSPKKHQSYKKTPQRQRIQNQTSRKTKGISDESGYFEEEVDDEGNEGQGTSQSLAYFNSPLIRENSPTISSLGAAHQQISSDNNKQLNSIETASKDSRESIEIIYDRNAEMSSRGASPMEASQKYLSKSNVFHPKTSSLLKTELLKEHIEYSQNVKKTSDHMGRNQKTMDLISSTMTPSTNLTSSSLVKHTIDTTASSSSSMLPTATVNSQIQSSGKTMIFFLSSSSRCPKWMNMINFWVNRIW